MLDSLTERESEILQLISQGMNNQEIADTLFLSRGTIKAHNHNIYSKLGVKNRSQAILRAQEIGILTEVASYEENDLRRITSHLPIVSTTLVGRKNELETIHNLLNDERVRLVTILGTGGMGKTHIAIEAAQQLRGQFEDGVHFISLTATTNPQNIITTIVDELGTAYKSTDTSQKQFLSFLKDKELLLVLDNFEHLVDGGTDLIDAIVQQTPNVKLMLTSRERLRLSYEVIVALEGLIYKISSKNDPLQASAIQLLVQRLQTIQPEFTLTAENLAGVQRICQLTQGMPLAIILAASWFEMLSVDDIADEIAHSIDILESQFRDLPERQRSCRATIASSWHRLNPDEQAIFAKLSVFRGGFSREAAQHVAKATLPFLQKLANRSLIFAHRGRYELHELLRQFLADELAKDSSAVEMTRDKHCEYYANYLHQIMNNIYRTYQHTSIESIITDIENIRLAWSWAVEHRKLDAIYQAVQTLGSFWHTQSRYEEGITTLEHTIAILSTEPVSEQRNLLIAIMSTDLAWYYLRWGRLEEAETLFKQAHQTFEAQDFPYLTILTDPLIGSAFIESIKGNYDVASAIAEKALALNKKLDHDGNQAYALYALIGIKLGQGFYDQARHYGYQAIEMTDKAGDRWLRAYCLIELGNVARAMGDYEVASQHYQASYEIREEFDDPEGMATALNKLGQLALRQSEFEKAEELYQESESIYRDINDQGGLSEALHGLAKVALANGAEKEGQDYLYEALGIAYEINYMSIIFPILITVAEFYFQNEQATEAHALLNFVQEHSSSTQEAKDYAAQIQNHYLQGHPNSDSASALPAEFEEVITFVQQELFNPL